jgi:CRP-like cAMP-binding protein
MSKIYESHNQGQDNTRLFTAAFLRYFLRICRIQQEAFHGDIEMAIIAQSVMLANIEPLTGEPKSRDKCPSMPTATGIAHRCGVTTMEIAQATGLPRETVRRKLLRLVELEFLERREDGKFIVLPPRSGREEGRAALAEIESESMAFLNTCFSEGIFKFRGK